MKRTVDIIAELRAAECDCDTWTLARLLLEAADRLEHFAWDGCPPRTPHLAADSSPVAGDVDAGASSTPTRRVDLPASRGLGGGEVRLATAAMPLTAAEFSDSDPTPAYGLARPMPRLWIVQP